MRRLLYPFPKGISFHKVLFIKHAQNLKTCHIFIIMIEYNSDKQDNYICQLEEVFAGMNEKQIKAIEILEEYGQNHIISLLEELNDIEKENLINQILTLDFKRIMKLYEQTKSNNILRENKIEPVEYTIQEDIEDLEKQELNEIGSKLIKNRKYAIVTMAGGQGTRLGHDGPKGTFLIDVKPKAKYLFEILADTLKKANEKYNTVIPWYIMTSKDNNEKTVHFFEEKEYFGYPKESIKFFLQGELPLIGENGEILLNENKEILFASDGNGSIYRSMKEKGILNDMRKKGIEWAYICSVDNILLQMVEPILLGLTIKQKNEIASKTVVKNGPAEKVGVFCKKGGKPTVIEYTELPKDMAELRDKKGELVFGEAHIMCNLFSLNALEKISEKELPYHIAFKPIKHYIDGKLIESNCYKFEQFIFDSFSFFENITLLRGKREEDFAPVKNREGVDSPCTAIELYNNKYKK